MIKKYYIYRVSPRDYYGDCTVKLHNWLSQGDDDLQEKEHKEKSILSAMVEVYEGGYHVRGETPDIRICYDYQSDGPFFLFRYTSDGMTLLVSSVELFRDKKRLWAGDDDGEADKRNR